MSDFKLIDYRSEELLRRISELSVKYNDDPHNIVDGKNGMQAMKDLIREFTEEVVQDLLPAKDDYRYISGNDDCSDVESMMQEAYETMGEANTAGINDTREKMISNAVKMGLQIK